MSLLTRHTKPFSSDTPRQKELLKEQVEGYRQQLNAQWQELQTNATHYGKHALIVGGVVAGVYVVLNTLLPEEEEETIDQQPRPIGLVALAQESSSIGPTIGKALRGIAWSLAIGWARQKVSHYLEAEKKSNAQKE